MAQGWHPSAYVPRDNGFPWLVLYPNVWWFVHWIEGILILYCLNVNVFFTFDWRHSFLVGGVPWQGIQLAQGHGTPEMMLSRLQMQFPLFQTAPPRFEIAQKGCLIENKITVPLSYECIVVTDTTYMCLFVQCLFPQSLAMDCFSPSWGKQIKVCHAKLKKHKQNFGIFLQTPPREAQQGLSQI